MSKPKLWHLANVYRQREYGVFLKRKGMRFEDLYVAMDDPLASKPANLPWPQMENPMPKKPQPSPSLPFPPAPPLPPRR